MEVLPLVCAIFLNGFQVNETYQLRCNTHRNIALFIGTNGNQSFYIAKEKSKVDVLKTSRAAFDKEYCMEVTEYSLADFANRTLKLKELGVQVTPRAAAHLTPISKEPLMAKVQKIQEPASGTWDTPDTPVVPAAKPAKEPKAPKAPKEPKAPKLNEDGTIIEPTPRNRREKIDGDRKIKVIGANPARLGTTRHAIVEFILGARTVAEALDNSVVRKDGTEYKIGMPDIYFALENKLIELI
jgi:hypothetical protein